MRCRGLTIIGLLAATTASAAPDASPASPSLIRVRPVAPWSRPPSLYAPDYVLGVRDSEHGAKLVRLDPSSGTETAVYETPGQFGALECDDAFVRCVLFELTKKTGVATTDALPSNVLLIERGAATVIAGGSMPAPGRAISPDGAWVLTTKFGATSSRLVAHNLATKQTIDTDATSEIVRWRKDRSDWTVVLKDGDAPAKEWHLADGKVTALHGTSREPPDDIELVDNRKLKRAKGRPVTLPKLDGCMWELGARVDDRFQALVCRKRLGFVDLKTSLVVMPVADGEMIFIAPGGGYAIELGPHDGYISRYEPKP